MSLNAGYILEGRYRIIRLLGEGGYGAVYLAEDLRLGNRHVAVKENLDRSAESVQQFQFEAQLLASLSHVCLPRVSDYFIAQLIGSPCLVMDFVEGQDLADFIGPSRPLDTRRAVTWIMQVAEAVAYLHEQRPQPIIHRDIKPENIKITPDGRAVLVDFGIAKVYHPQKRTVRIAKAASDGFAPPEQYQLTRTTDTRSDVYALGATLYCLLTGSVPPDAVARQAGLAQMISPRQLNMAVPPALDRIILQSMDLDANRRYTTAREFHAALRTWLDSQPVAPAAPSVVCPCCKNVNRATARFCKVCGMVLAAPLAPAPVQAPPPPASGLPIASPPPLGPTLDAEQAAQHNQHGLTHSKASQFDRAASEYQQAVCLDPQCAIYHYNLAAAYYNLDRYKEALPEARAAVALDQSDADFFNNLGQVCYALEMYDEALQATQNAIHLQPQGGVFYYNLGMVYEGLDQLDEAARALQEAERLLPANADLQNRLGNVYFHQKQYTQAASHYQKAASLEPSNAIFHCNLAYAYAKWNRAKEAVSEYRQAIRLDAHYARPHNELGDLLQSESQWTDALREYEEAVRLDPDNATYQFDLARAYRQLKRNADAKRATQTAIRLAPNEATLHNLLGLILFEEDNYAGALTAQQRALHLKPDDATLAFNVAMDLEALGRASEAIQMYQRALSIDPTLDDAREHIRTLSKW